MVVLFSGQDAITVGNELRQAAFRAYASLGANDEDIRKKVAPQILSQHYSIQYFCMFGLNINFKE